MKGVNDLKSVQYLLNWPYKTVRIHAGEFMTSLHVIHLSRTQMGDAWPLTIYKSDSESIDNSQLRCSSQKLNSLNQPINM